LTLFRPAAVALLSILACAQCREHDDPPILSRVQGAVMGERFTLGRLAGHRWQACDSSNGVPGSTRICARPLRLGTDEFERFRRVANYSELGTLPRNPSTLRASALVDLRASGDSRAALDRAVSSLEEARRSSADDPVVLNDLAVAYLEQGVRDEQLEPLLRALDAVEHALRTDSSSVEAWFNRALILDRLNLIGLAVPAWESFVGRERDAEWKREAHSRASQIGQRSDTLTSDQYPQQARDALFRLLGDWAVGPHGEWKRDRERVLDTARAIADSVEKLRADSTVIRVVGWLEQETSAARFGEAMQAIADFARGNSLNERAAYEAALPFLARSQAALDRLDSPLAGWVAYAFAAAEMNSGNLADAEARLLRILRSASPTDVALVGKVYWLRGVIELRRGNYEIAARHYRDARPYFARAKDGKNEAAVSYLLTEALSLGGQRAECLREALRGLRLLSPFRRSFYLHNHLITVAVLARVANLRLATLDVVDEAIDVNKTLNRPDGLASSLATRARDLALLGDTLAALRDLGTADSAAHLLNGQSRAVAVAGIDVARGRLLRGGDPAQATRILTRAADSYRQMGMRMFRPAVLLELAVAARAMGDTAVARARLLEAVATIEQAQASFLTAESRSSFYDTVEEVFDTIIDVELDAGRAEAAFQWLERARLAVGSTTGRARVPVSFERIRQTLPDRMLFVEYIVLPRRTIIWCASRATSDIKTITIPRDSLAQLIEAFRSEIRNDLPSPSLGKDRLSMLLLGGIASEMKMADEITIVPDRELSEIPFAALQSPRSAQFLVQDYTIRVAPSAAFHLASSTVDDDARNPSVLVVNPDESSAPSADLRPLRGAKREAMAVANGYSKSLLLSGPAARRDSVLSALTRYGIFHFAGHAIFDGERPERSYLALSAAQQNSPDRLLAREIAELRLSNVHLVVLSACSTLRSRSSHTGAVSGLAFSFLRAGVPRTVSALWDVDDDAVVDLLVEFHKSVARGVSPAAALRRAQVTALTSTHSLLRSPGVWAAFVYAGH
jgi:CHAT domain-containing protein